MTNIARNRPRTGAGSRAGWLLPVIFALGETIWSPTAPALINSIAPHHLRGRYNSAQSLTWSLGATLAPLASGALIGAGRGVTWALLIAVGCFAAAAFAQTLRPMLTPAEDGREPAVAAS